MGWWVVRCGTLSGRVHCGMVGPWDKGVWVAGLWGRLVCDGGALDRGVWGDEREGV